MKEKHWNTIETDRYVVCLPNNDSKPHGERISDLTYNLDTLLCLCKPEIQWEDGWEKKIVIHNAWDGREWEEMGLALPPKT